MSYTINYWRKLSNISRSPLGFAIRSPLKAKGNLDREIPRTIGMYLYIQDGASYVPELLDSYFFAPLGQWACTAYTDQNGDPILWPTGQENLWQEHIDGFHAAIAERQRSIWSPALIQYHDYLGNFQPLIGSTGYPDPGIFVHYYVNQRTLTFEDLQAAFFVTSIFSPGTAIPDAWPPNRVWLILAEQGLEWFDNRAAWREYLIELGYTDPLLRLHESSTLAFNSFVSWAETIVGVGQDYPNGGVFLRGANPRSTPIRGDPYLARMFRHIYPFEVGRPLDDIHLNP